MPLIVDFVLALAVVVVIFAIFTPIKSVLLANESHHNPQRKEPDGDDAPNEIL